MIGIDFDAVVHQYDGEFKSSPEGEPIAGSLGAILILQEMGKEPYIFTARDVNEVKTWLSDNGFPDLEVTNEKKPETEVYIDDRAIQFTGKWDDDLINQILEFKPYWESGNSDEARARKEEE